MLASLPLLGCLLHERRLDLVRLGCSRLKRDVAKRDFHSVVF